MRRLLAILLLAAFALTVVAPAFALGEDSDASLPACCRRHGQHHCGMLRPGAVDGSGHHLTPVYAMWPQRAVASSAAFRSVIVAASPTALAIHSTIAETRPTRPS